jgi:SOS-response transcriptional repressor LexA
MKESPPLFLNSVQAGFPSPAEDYIERKLDLNEHLVAHPAATFFVRVEGDSMLGVGIHKGDILIVDRSLTAESAGVPLRQGSLHRSNNCRCGSDFKTGRSREVRR